MTYFQIPTVYGSFTDKNNNPESEDLSLEYFPEPHYELMHHKARLMSNDEDQNSVPDFRFNVKGSKIAFWVEGKFRIVKQLNEFIPVFKAGQLDRLKGFENSFLFLRVKIQREEYSFFVPIQHIKTDELHFSFLRPYLLNVSRPVDPNLVSKYLVPSDQDFPSYFSAGILS